MRERWGGRPLSLRPCLGPEALILQLEMGLPWETSPKRGRWGGMPPEGVSCGPFLRLLASRVGARGRPCVRRQGAARNQKPMEGGGALRAGGSAAGSAPGATGGSAGPWGAQGRGGLQKRLATSPPCGLG